LGGYSFYYKVLLGRRDARNASQNDANNDLPSPLSNFTLLLSNFQAQGLNLKDLVALSGGHTIGLARCVAFRGRIYNDTNINPAFKASKQQQCPLIGGDIKVDNVTALSS
jgi:peroxidase